MRLALNVPLLAAGDRRAAELQHIAFACDDALAAARRMRRARRPAAARSPTTTTTTSPPGPSSTRELIEALRELGVLYDRDDARRAPALLHPVVGGRLFFEVVERRGGYDGYGAANSPVRLGAQRAHTTGRAAASR